MKIIKKKQVLEESEEDYKSSCDQQGFGNNLPIGNPDNFFVSNVESIYTQCNMSRQKFEFSKENSIVGVVNMESFNRNSE